MSGPLHHLTIAAASDLIARRELSPVELAKAFLERIQTVDGRLSSYVLPTPERALADARRAERELMAGRLRGPLHGIPIALKDIYFTAGIRTTCHSRLLLDHVPAADSEVGRRLAGAGTVLLGKLATHEFAFGGPDPSLPFPPARNPWNTEHFTGGSSSGSGAAVAAGLCMGAMGSDTGGSIRLPAAFCGIVGIKPTYGRASRRGVAPLAQSLDHCGPMTWCVEDAALMLQAIAGLDPADPGSAAEPVPDWRAALTGDVRGLRIGVIRHFYEEDHPAVPAQRAAMDEALGVLASMGAAVEEVRLAPLMRFHACCFVIMLTEALAIHARDLRRTPEKYGDFLRDRLMLASFLSGEDYVQAQRLRRRLKAEVDAAFASHDLLVTAGAFGPAPPLFAPGKFDMFRMPNLTGPFDVTGHPAMTMCCGFADGLPLGIQLIGRAFDEATVFRVGDTLEKATPWRDRRPPI